jgi:hypothetical protein
MKNLLFLFVMLLVASVSLEAQSNQQKKEEKKEKTQWVIKGAKVFNSKAEAKPLQVNKPIQTRTQQQIQPQVQRPPYTQMQPLPQVQARTPVQAYPQTQVQARTQTQPQPRTPATRPTARIISVPQNNTYQPQTRTYNTNVYEPQVQTYDNYGYEGYQMEMKSMAVMETQEYMNQGTHNALVVEIEGADARVAEKVWSDFVKDNYGTRVKKVKRSDDHIAEGVNVGIVGAGNGVNLYSRAEDRGRSAKFMVWMDVGNDYLSSASYPSWYNTAENMMYEYKLEVKRELVREELKEEEKNLKKLQNDLKRLQSLQERYHKIIEDSYKRIQKAESDIAQNDGEQQGMVQEIEQQMMLIQQVMNKLNSIQ